MADRVDPPPGRPARRPPWSGSSTITAPPSPQVRGPHAGRAGRARRPAVLAVVARPGTAPGRGRALVVPPVSPGERLRTDVAAATTTRRPRLRGARRPGAVVAAACDLAALGGTAAAAVARCGSDLDAPAANAGERRRAVAALAARAPRSRSTPAQRARRPAARGHRRRHRRVDPPRRTGAPGRLAGAAVQLPPVTIVERTTVATIEAVGAREILDSRGNPTVEVEVALDDGTLAGRPCPAGRPPAPSRRSSCATARPATAARACRRPSTPCWTTIGPELLGFEASEQRLVDAGAHRSGRHPDKSQLGANAILGVSLAVAKAAADVGRAAAVPLRRRPERLPAAGADDEHPQRWRARRLQRRRPGIHDRADRRGHLRRGAAHGRGGLPRAEVGAEGEGAVHRPRRRGRLRARPRLQPGRAGPHRRGGRAGRPDAGHRHRARARRRRDRVLLRRRLPLRGRRKSRRRDDRATTPTWSTDYPIVSIEDPLSEDDWDGWIALTGELGAARPARRRRPVRHQPGAARPAASTAVRPTRCW